MMMANNLRQLYTHLNMEKQMLHRQHYHRFLYHDVIDSRTATVPRVQIMGERDRHQTSIMIGKGIV